MKSIKEIADKYIREQYIDYGDLNDQAETQIRDAVIFGLTQGQKLPIDSVGHCSKGRLAEEFQKGYKEGYEDGIVLPLNNNSYGKHS